MEKYVSPFESDNAFKYASKNTKLRYFASTVLLVSSVASGFAASKVGDLTLKSESVSSTCPVGADGAYQFQPGCEITATLVYENNSRLSQLLKFGSAATLAASVGSFFFASRRWEKDLDSAESKFA